MNLHFKKTTLGYGNRIAIKGFSAKLKAGSLVAVTGDNGAGKSTLLKAIAGLIKPLKGKVIKPKNSRIAYLSQQCDIDQTFPIDVKTLVRTGLWSFCGLWKNQRPYESKIQNALEMVGLTALASRSLETLSGGQLQRALFARIIVQDADIILLDEPFNGIDRNTQKDLLTLITYWQQQGRTVLTALHDPLVVREFFPQMIQINQQNAFYGETTQFLDNTIHPIMSPLTANPLCISARKRLLPINDSLFLRL
ncbi:ABC transporter ATP-binding protein [Bartonella krasnovii]|uniref:ABC transporter ATP-binding protein n=1 Tax=Bartonella krasnovii TaxID=2267275 RepID=A0A5B9D0G0_9HYPH|nr:ABC transporter ATP-binding protein [Bartonella krasnovii]QEE11524.1 ABC transporter ATP-binding protein [Bartonella krasnovii]UNF29280.1 ABC transporter ATP-binding protein [Bartonella krasnovii]UNF35637.1 ABC transporter ATP-binding protein [Bartonella krasnovii]UNF37257.1 ABC transporter ATP-binding protein [Bartonella krasnovii]UNF38951.1 ABC transporter ATP-binding protein [Bartonella krasnovii]